MSCAGWSHHRPHAHREHCCFPSAAAYTSPYIKTSLPRRRGRDQLVKKGKAFSDKRGLRFALRLGVHLRWPFDARYARGVFVRRTRRRKKRFEFISCLRARNSTRFFDSLKCKFICPRKAGVPKNFFTAAARTRDFDQLNYDTAGCLCL